ncbi:hypothetical protein [Zoogloea dura]|uniref:Uncharacterized protein n=1 Tax=Zoogloea dura TaxID=2728840 RepID=A0A848FZP7_9RHOO|nr:hypothetical protein [Zoogloea dura]NML24339.1 hypothetical protein [Zoogloea dura]
MLRSNVMQRAVGRAFDRTYGRLERDAIAAARRNNAMLLYVPDAPGAALQTSVTGYTPATPNTPIGRLLDMQYGPPRLGPELLANPSFNTDATGWTPYANTTLASVGGKLRMGTTTGPSQPMLAMAAVATIPGQTYQLFATSATKTAQVGVFQLQATNNASGAGAYASTTFGVFGAQSMTDLTLIFVASATVTYVVLRADGGASATTADYSEWDNVSLRQTIDAPGSRGPELVTNGDFTSWSGDNPAGWTLSFTETASEYVTQASPGARLVSTTGVFNEIAQNAGLINGKAYEVIVQVTACTGSGSVSNASASPISFSSPGWYRGIFTAVGGSIGLKRSTGGAASDFTVGSISCKEIPGYHCTQPTAANKPVLVKVPRRKGPDLVVNGVFDSAASWTSANASFAGGGMTIAAQFGNAWQSVSVRNGAYYELAYTVTAASGTAPLALSSTGFTGATTVIPTVVGRNTILLQCVNETLPLKFIAPNASTSVTVDDVSLREVAEWSNGVQFDGTDDFLDVTFRDYYAAGASTFIGSWWGPVTGNSSFGLVQSSTASVTPLYAPFGIPTTSVNASYFMRDDSGSAVLNFRTYAAGAYSGSGVVSAVDHGARLVGRDHGTVAVDVTFARPGTLTSNKITVGAAQRTAVSGFAKATIALLCWSANVMPDADRRAIERFAAFLVGEPHV